MFPIKKAIMAGKAPKEIIRIKILSMGDSGTGKSCLIKRFCEQRFLPEYVSTIGIDYGVQGFKTHLDDSKTSLTKSKSTFGMWEETSITLKSGMSSTEIHMAATFDNLTKWLKEFNDHAGAPIELAIVGNKIDKEGREVRQEEAERFASDLNAKYYETSALSGDNVEEMFKDLFYASLGSKFPSQ